MKKTVDLLNAINSDIDLDELLKDANDYDFGMYVDNLLEEKNLKKKDVIKNSGLDEKYAYKILRGEKGFGSKDKLLCLAIAMQLDQRETNHFLSLQNAGDLYAQNKRDLIIMSGMHKKMTVDEINDLLYEKGFPTLDEKSNK